MARLLGQLFEIKQLGAAISFTEGMDVIHITKDSAGGSGELRAAQVAKKIPAFEPPVNIVHAGRDEPLKLEQMPAFGDLHRPDFAGPIIGVLKQVPVYGLKVGKLEAALRHAFDDSLRDERPFDPVQPFRIRDPMLVPKNRRTLIAVWIVANHSIAEERAWRRM
jgi:hypothetical protein